MTRLVKTSFEEEQRVKDEQFLSLDPLERWRIRLIGRERMKKKGVDYSLKGKKVIVKKFH